MCRHPGGGSDGGDGEGRMVGQEGRIQPLGGDVGDVLAYSPVPVDIRLSREARDGERDEPRPTTNGLAGMVSCVELLFRTSALAAIAA